MMNSNLEYVGFWLRVVAALIDSVIYMIIAVPLLIGIYGASYFNSGSMINGPIDFLITWVLPLVAIVVCWIKWQATPGKRAIGAMIVDAKTGKEPVAMQYLVRYVGYYISAIPLCLGLIWVGIDRKKRGWHDLLAGTVVVRKKSASVEFQD